MEEIMEFSELPAMSILEGIVEGASQQIIEKDTKASMFRIAASSTVGKIFDVLDMNASCPTSSADAHAGMEPISVSASEDSTPSTILRALCRVQDFIETSESHVTSFLISNGTASGLISLSQVPTMLKSFNLSLANHEVEFLQRVFKDKTEIGIQEIRKSLKVARDRLEAKEAKRARSKNATVFVVDPHSEEPVPCPADFHAPNSIVIRSERLSVTKQKSKKSPAAAVTSKQLLPTATVVVAEEEPEEDDNVMTHELKTPREVDTTTLSHILSLATPRVIDPEEHQRRKELLEYLEMCDENKRQQKLNALRIKEDNAKLEKQIKAFSSKAYNLDHLGNAILLESSLPPSNFHQFKVPVAAKTLRTPRNKEVTRVAEIEKHENEKSTELVFIPKAAPTQLDTSRLATGVKAVYGGVEKSGPIRLPSRNTRIRRHNYKLELCEISNVKQLPPIVKKKDEVVEKQRVEEEPSQKLPPLKLTVKQSKRKVVNHSDQMIVMKKSFNRVARKQATWDPKISPPRVRQHAPRRLAKRGLMPHEVSCTPRIKRDIQTNYFYRTLRKNDQVLPTRA